jgi:hypothetical protein
LYLKCLYLDNIKVLKMRSLKVIIVLLFISSVTIAQNHPAKPDYVGHIEYTKGNFGTYNYPVKGDSILVYLKDSSVDFVIFSKEGNNPRSVEINSSDLKRVSKKMYNNIVTPTEIVPTGNYDQKFISKNSNGYSGWTLYITHFGDGSTADMTLIGESDGTRLNDFFTASLIKLK